MVSAIDGVDSETVRFRSWKNTGELAELVDKVLALELDVSADDLVPTLERSLGAAENDRGYLEFDRGCARRGWTLADSQSQPQRPFGIDLPESRCQGTAAQERLRRAVEANSKPFYQNWFRFTKPRGPEQIVYGDKVICIAIIDESLGYMSRTSNLTRKSSLPTARWEWSPVSGNGVRATRNSRTLSFQIAAIEISDLHDQTFPRTASLFLELGYASTGPQQGSEFDSVILVLPWDGEFGSCHAKCCTRRDHSEKRTHIESALEGHFVEVSGEFGNMCSPTWRQGVLPICCEHPPMKRCGCRPNIPAGFRTAKRQLLEEKLIHRTIRGEMVSSKNEVVIANILYYLEKPRTFVRMKRNRSFPSTTGEAAGPTSKSSRWRTVGLWRTQGCLVMQATVGAGIER